MELALETGGTARSVCAIRQVLASSAITFSFCIDFRKRNMAILPILEDKGYQWSFETDSDSSKTQVYPFLHPPLRLVYYVYIDLLEGTWGSLVTAQCGYQSALPVYCFCLDGMRTNNV